MKTTRWACDIGDAPTEKKYYNCDNSYVFCHERYRVNRYDIE